MNIPYLMPMNYFLGTAWETTEKPFFSSLKRRQKKAKRAAQAARIGKKIKLFRGRETASEKLQTYELLYILKRDASETLYLARSTDGGGLFHIKQTNFMLADYLSDHRVTPLQRKRFKMEQRVLARMRHPNIAGLVETGLTEDGRLYFVSEAVNGKTLLSYCNEHRLDLHQRLELCVQICEAVHYAHSKGIFHRAVYPSNILIAKRDGRPHPVLVNLGAMGYPGAPVFAARTAEARGYRSPQAGSKMQSGTVTSETPAFQREVSEEIYALGALVHHLLMGVTPVEPSVRLASDAAASGVMAPSRRWASLAKPLRAEIAAERGVHERELCRIMRSDLEAVLIKALHHDPDQRYLTAWDLAADLRAYVEDRPVGAHPRSTAYVMGKFLCRHKRTLAVALLGSLVLLSRL